MRIYLLLLLVLMCCQSGFGQSAAETNPGLPFRPHILWLVAEDLSPVLPMYGDSTVETPNLSRLAREGVVFTHFFSPSGVCAPSRAAIATGMYPTAIGAQHMRTMGFGPYMPEGVPPYECVPPPFVKMHSEYLRELGYFCTNNPKEDYQFRRSVVAWDQNGPAGHWRNRAPGQPFFSIFNFGITHESMVWGQAKDSLWVPSDLKVPVPPYLPDTEPALTDIRRVYSNVKVMDFQVGQILAQLEADGLLDSTIIFWYGDHGGPLPRQKRAMYDSGIRLPMIVRFPNGWKAGTEDHRMLSFIDLLPTLVSLAGEEPPAEVNGKAFYGPYAVRKSREMIFAASDRFDEHTDRQRVVRTRQYKYIFNASPEKPMYMPLAFREQMGIMQEMLRLRDAGLLTPEQALWFQETKPREELYDLEKDPYELNNLAENSEYAKVLKTLRAACRDWLDGTGDLGAIPEAQMVAAMWPDLKQPQTAPPLVTRTEAGWVITSSEEGASVGYQWVTPGATVLLERRETPYGAMESFQVQDGGTKTELPAWQIPRGAIPDQPGRQLVAIAHRLGWMPSEVVSP